MARASSIASSVCACIGPRPGRQSFQAAPCDMASALQMPELQALGEFVKLSNQWLHERWITRSTSPKVPPPYHVILTNEYPENVG